MLVIYSTTSPTQVLTKIGGVVSKYPDSVLKFASSYAELLTLLPLAKAVLVLGTQTLEELQGLGIVAKGRKTTSLRKQVLQVQGVPMMVSYSPAISEVNYAWFVNLLTDVAMALRLAATGSTTPKYGDYKYISSLQPIYDELQQLTQTQTVNLAFDTETLGLDRFHPDGYLISLQFSWKPGEACMIVFPDKKAASEFFDNIENQTHLSWLLTCPKISLRGANGKYDLEWVYEQTGITCTNFKFDTMLAGSLLDENRSNALDIHTKIYVPELGGYSDDFDAKADKSRMDLEYLKSPSDFLLYSAGDADATYRSAVAMREDILADNQLACFYVNILHPSARAFEQVERHGVCIDMQAFDELEADLIADTHRLIGKAKRVLGGILVAKHHDPDKIGNINLTKASLIKDFMFSPQGLNLKPKMMTAGGPLGIKPKEPSTAMQHLEMFKDVPEAKEFVQVMSEFSSTSKTLSTYIIGFRKHIRSDGRMHPTYWLHKGDESEGEGGTNTGRLSVKDPAFQCLKGDTPVLTDKGYLPIQQIVEQHEQGVQFKVLTHTGKWKPVIGSYRNGVQPVFSVSSESATIHSTANHPFLTSRGWVRTDELEQGETCYDLREDAWTQYARPAESDLSQLGGNEESLHQPNIQGLGQVWWPGDKGMRAMDGLRQFPYRHGYKARNGVEHRARECERELRAGELLVGHPENTGIQQDEHQADYSQWVDQNRGTVGYRLGNLSGTVALSTICGPDHGASLDEDQAPDRDSFKEGRIVSVVPAGECETFDLTIEDSHSFVANGFVVHNTIPKHTHWGKRIRRCYIAPDGMLVLENDYSQGELKVMACLANEQAMLAAYMQGLDLHVVTSGSVAGYTYEEMMAMKKSDKDQFDAIRQLGKAGNFGLIYGMGVDGFVIYALNNYGVELSWDKANEFRSGFFNTYPGLLTYHAEYKAYAHKHEQVRGPLGRVRHLPLINSIRKDVSSQEERRAINSPVQGTLSDMMCWAISEQYQMGWFDQSPCFGAIHDAGYYYVPQDNPEFYAKRTVQVMENLPFHKVGWEPQLKFTADAKLGLNMADLKEVKFS